MRKEDDSASACIYLFVYDVGEAKAPVARGVPQRRSFNVWGCSGSELFFAHFPLLILAVSSLKTISTEKRKIK